MNKAEKAIHLCQEYDRLLKAIDQNRKDIGSVPCSREVISTEECMGETIIHTSIPDGEKSHLSEVFEGYDSDGNWEPVHHHFNQFESLELIGDCEGCLKSYWAVQARKANRKQLGSIKRSIRALGRAE